MRRCREYVVYVVSFLLWTMISVAFANNETALTHVKMVSASSSSSTHAFTQIVLDFNHPVSYKIFTLPHPSRLVVDLENTRYVFKEGKSLDLSGTEVIGFRHGIQKGRHLRMVFDLKMPMHFAIQTHHDKDFFQIMLELTSLGEVAKIPTKISTENSPPVENTEKPKFVVVIDAGHGGIDPGAEGPEGTQEKNVTLAIAKALQVLVEAQPNMTAVMTRREDKYVGLRQRLMIARRAKGDVFVAIHADAFNQPDAEGASVFALSLHGASSEAALWLAKKENYSELGGIDLNGIAEQDNQVRSVLIDLSQTATIGASLQLGGNVIQQLGKITDLHRGVVEQAPFMVLKSPDIPSILVETGFISNPKEEARLKTYAYQEKIAEALMAGITAYYQKNALLNLPVVVSKK